MLIIELEAARASFTILVTCFESISFPESTGCTVSGFRLVKLWGNGNFNPRNLGFRLLCACFARKTEVKNWKKKTKAQESEENSELHSRYTTRIVKWINAFMGDLKAPLKKK